MLDIHPYIQPIQKLFETHSNAPKAERMKAYLKNHFEFFGLQAPLRRTLSKEHFKKYPVKDLNELEEIVKVCFSMPEREYQYFGIELYAFHKKMWKPSSIKLMEYCLKEKSWWDSVDQIASDWLGLFFIRFPELTYTITSLWNASDNIWLQRSSIMFQKAYKQNTDIAILAKYILSCHTSKEFFIQKAIGWALHEYARTDPEWVRQFVKKYPLAPLSKREAIKGLPK